MQMRKKLVSIEWNIVTNSSNSGRPTMAHAQQSTAASITDVVNIFTGSHAKV